MLINDFLKKGSIYNVIASESMMSIDFRNKLSKISKTLITILIFFLLFLYFTKNSLNFVNLKIFVDAYGLIDKTIGLILFNLGIFIYSHLAQFYLSSTYYFEKIVNNEYKEGDVYTFSAGRILYAGRKTDILHGFLKSKIGELVFYRLGISKKDVKEFYDSTNIIEKENIPVKDGEILKAKDLITYLYSNNKDFSQFLTNKGIKEKDLLEATDFVISDIETKEYRSQWWRPEILAKIKPLIK